MLSVVLCLFTLIQGVSCFESDNKITQQLRTGRGISAFKAVTMHHATLHKKLMNIANEGNVLIPDCMSIVLEYYRAWKKYAEIPTLRGDFVHPRAAFIKYNNRDCLATQDSFDYQKYYRSDRSYAISKKC